MKFNWIIFPMLTTLSSIATNDNLIKPLCSDYVCNTEPTFKARNTCLRLVCNHHVTCGSVTCSNGSFFPCGT